MGEPQSFWAWAMNPATKPKYNTRYEIKNQQKKMDEAWLKDGLVLKNETRKARFYDGGALGLYSATRRNPDWVPKPKPKEEEKKKEDDKKEKEKEKRRRRRPNPYQNWPDFMQHMGFYQPTPYHRAPARPHHHRPPPLPPHYPPRHHYPRHHYPHHHYPHHYCPPPHYHGGHRGHHYYPAQQPYNTSFKWSRQVTGPAHRVKGTAMSPPYFPEKYRKYAQARYAVPLPGTYNVRPVRPRRRKDDKSKNDGKSKKDDKGNKSETKSKK